MFPLFKNNGFRLFLIVLVTGMLPAGLFAQTEIPEEVQAAEKQRIETIERVTPSVVAIFPPDGRGGGSGVLISPDGLTLTNFHVVQGAGPFLKCGLSDGNIYDAVLIGIDPTGDVAIIQLLGRDDFPHAPLGDSDTVEAGDWAFAMGNPFLLAQDFKPTLTYGMVSGVHRYQYPAGTFLEYTDCIQVDTSINPGNSGGPLFNEQGEVVGINGRISVEKRGRVNVGAGYAISINQIKNFRDHLLSGRIVDHATLGATVRTDEFSNVIVDSILSDCSAYFHGLRQGDEIISFGGRPIGSVNQFKNVLGIYPKGWKIPLVYRRDGERHEIYPRLEALHSTGELLDFAAMPAAPENPEEQPEKEETPDEEPKENLPIPMIPQHQAPEIPDEYAHLYEDRTGFANYHFNKIEQERLLRSIDSLGEYGTEPQKWMFRGQIEGGAEYQLSITPFAGLVKIPSREVTELLDLGRPETYSAGIHSGGMLLALYEWQQLMMKGTDELAELYYVGSEPLDGKGPKVDVLLTQHEAHEIRWLFDKEDGRLVGWDLKYDSEKPECGIRVADWKFENNRALPTEMTILVPGHDPVTFAVETMESTPVEKPEL